MALVSAAVAELGHGALGPQQLLQELSTRIQRAVPFDVGGLLLLDPDTLLPVGHGPLRSPPGFAAALLRNEVTIPDVNKFSDLAQRSSPVALQRPTDSDAGSSPRRQRILDPLGLGDELRVVFREQGSTWGAAGLVRERGAPSFDSDEIAFMAQIAEDVGRAIRCSLAARPATVTPGTAPGAFLFDERLEIVSATPAARTWEALMPPHSTIALHAVALRAQALGVGDGGMSLRSRLRLTTGEWLVLHAARLEATAKEPQRLTAVTLEPAQGDDLASLLLRLHGLSTREREVAAMLLEGLPTDATAQKLSITSNTLRDHVKSVFAKVGVSSRPELMAFLSGDAPAPG
jgi:DNA-binding CsgD family transcriptional regulator